jgi:hypothetical protein
MAGLAIYSMFSGTSMNPYMKGGIAVANAQKNKSDLSQSKAQLDWKKDGDSLFGDNSLSKAADLTAASTFFGSSEGG